ncbi:MAG: aldo/keto reductase [Acidobacteria bacterium]|nr:aldo/keto reductase [Acidobacteriota bacterium]
MTTGGSTRRDFLRTAASAACATAIGSQALAQTSSASATGIPTRVLGRTGQRVSIIGVGGAHARAIKDDAEVVRYMHMAVDEGVTFFDNAWDYSDGAAEEVMGKALAQDSYRARVFLMTKNCGRDYADSVKCLEDSLRRLRTDYLDLWQFHEINYDNDPDWVFEKGAIKAAMEARQAGKVRYIGFTGHKDPRIHLAMGAKPYEWDTSQMPINVMDAHYRSFQKQVVPEFLKRNMGIIGIKGLGGGRILGAEGLTAEECLRYCLSQPVTVQVLGMTSIDQLKQNVAVARGFKPMTAEETAKMLARVKEVASDGRTELFKSTQRFDGVVHRRQHGFATS